MNGGTQPAVAVDNQRHVALDRVLHAAQALGAEDRAERIGEAARLIQPCMGFCLSTMTPAEPIEWRYTSGKGNPAINRGSAIRLAPPERPPRLCG